MIATTGQLLGGVTLPAPPVSPPGAFEGARAALVLIMKRPDRIDSERPFAERPSPRVNCNSGAPRAFGPAGEGQIAEVFVVVLEIRLPAEGGNPREHPGRSRAVLRGASAKGAAERRPSAWSALPNSLRGWAYGSFRSSLHDAPMERGSVGFHPPTVKGECSTRRLPPAPRPRGRA